MPYHSPILATRWRDQPMFGDGPLLFREYVMHEPHPLAIVHAAVIDFLRGRDDAALFGAQAVNAYVDEARATQDVDILSPRAAELAEEIRQHLNQKFHIEVCVREVRGGIGYRIFQLQKPKNRHLVDVRPVVAFPPTQRVEKVLVLTPPELVASKVITYQSRRGAPKSFTDWRDLAVLLLKFPELKTKTGLVMDRLIAAGAEESVLSAWSDLVETEIRAEDEEAGY
ncbi:MAG TPA: nucleotidyl transferase AbiEii/AbiGii toxin family protein [Tepidisphaeraceae bacterium]|nr:nucleotidyl transferase AbiEii/AbiGii toxin family protein [Tepidisphaeraceae bacterium]